MTENASLSRPDEAEVLRAFFREHLAPAAASLPLPEWLRPDAAARSYWRARDPRAPLVFAEDARPLAERLAELWREEPEALRGLAGPLATLAAELARQPPSHGNRGAGAAEAAKSDAEHADDGEPTSLIYAMF